MCVIFRLQQVSTSSEACIPHGNNPSSTPAKHPRSNAHLLQQHTIPHTTVAVATTIIKDAMVTYRTLQSERPKHTKSFVHTLLWAMLRDVMDGCLSPQLLSASPNWALTKFSIQNGWQTQRRENGSHSP